MRYLPVALGASTPLPHQRLGSPLFVDDRPASPVERKTAHRLFSFLFLWSFYLLFSVQVFSEFTKLGLFLHSSFPLSRNGHGYIIGCFSRLKRGNSFRALLPSGLGYFDGNHQGVPLGALGYM
ncbi:uncharacterized protein K452DRAFT_68077 [Aplosporella prunicola CBS 121167]|uniref:Uncharacterized protein n=1 Tax=Aplosporella prunicola CBS 121167 TaxID=1176127 RepID=A0A6A6BTJ9_9PEZI|nr:uncharacterized protein K452DRAFT_68077 [Aplosporella prunicola CBS 121167]KAF2146595.1 hypothetical protein K452DRAFT_68077 [Aplosporella prunicola CBS 121167]